MQHVTLVRVQGEGIDKISPPFVPDYENMYIYTVALRAGNHCVSYRYSDRRVTVPISISASAQKKKVAGRNITGIGTRSVVRKSCCFRGRLPYRSAALYEHNLRYYVSVLVKWPAMLPPHRRVCTEIQSKRRECVSVRYRVDENTPCVARCPPR